MLFLSIISYFNNLTSAAEFFDGKASDSLYDRFSSIDLIITPG
jgi:hypothetical protein